MDNQPDGSGRRPRVVCLCGSTRFLEAFDQASIDESLAGRIVLGIVTARTDEQDPFTGRTPAEQQQLREQLAALHRAKIDLADEILVINLGGYIGETTRSEIEYARATGTPVRHLEPDAG